MSDANNLDNTVREHLQNLLVEHGRDLCREPQRCKNLLNDRFKGQFPLEVNLLAYALEEQVAKQLLEADENAPVSVLLSRLINLLKSNRGITQENAEWAVMSWAIALDKMPKTASIKPQEPPLPPSPPAGEVAETLVEPPVRRRHYVGIMALLFFAFVASAVVWLNINQETARKAATDKVVANKAAIEKKATDDKAAAEKKKAADDKAAAEKKAADDKAAAEKKAADDKAAAEKKAADDKAAAEKKAADDKAAAEKKKAADRAEAEKKKAAADKAAAEKKAAASKRTQRIRTLSQQIDHYDKVIRKQETNLIDANLNSNNNSVVEIRHILQDAKNKRAALRKQRNSIKR